MDNIQFVKKTTSVIDKALITQKKMYQSFAYMFCRVQPHQSSVILGFIEQTLFNFVESFKSYYQQQMVKNGIQAISNAESFLEDIQNYSYQIFFLQNNQQSFKQKELNKQKVVAHFEINEEIQKYFYRIVEEITKYSKCKEIEQFIANLEDLIVTINQPQNKIMEVNWQIPLFDNCQSNKIDLIHDQMNIISTDNYLFDNNLLSKQSLKKKNKEQLPSKSSFQECLNIQNFPLRQEQKKQPFSELKNDYYQRIIRMKQNYCFQQNKLFQKQFEYFWLFKLTNQQIYTKVMKFYRLQQLNMLKEQFETWEVKLIKRSWKFEQICYNHKRKVYYQCFYQRQRERKYLCNYCIYEQNNNVYYHQNHEIKCQKHKMPIKYRLYPSGQKKGTKQALQEKKQEEQQEKQQQQQFVCRNCNFLLQHSILVSFCHYKQVIQICIEAQCIEKDCFMICPICEHEENHRKTPFDRKSLIEKFSINDTPKTALYQKELVLIKDMLKLTPISKIRMSFTEKIIPILKFLESFTIQDNKKVEQLINYFMKQGKKEDLMVLKGLQQMKIENCSQSDKLCYLETFSHLINKQLQEVFKQIWGKILNCYRKITQFKSIDKRGIGVELNNKYEQLIDVEFNNKAALSPNQINKNHSNRAKMISVIKESEVQKDQLLRKQWKDKRGKFFRAQIKKRLRQQYFRKQQQKQIVQYLTNASQNEQNQLQINLKQSTKLEKYEKIIYSLQQQYNRINKQCAKKLRECLPLTNIIQNEFHSLRFMQIQYSPNYKYDFTGNEYQLRYQIDAFALFKFINYNSQLEQVIIKGVQVQNFQVFVMLLNPNNLASQKREEKAEIKLFKPWALRLTLQSVYQLHPKFEQQFNANYFISRIEDLSYFRRHFQLLSDITIVIRFEDSDWGSILQNLLICLKGIKNIKLEINNMDWILLKQLLNGLAFLTEISSLTLTSIKFAFKLSATDYSGIERNFKNLFKNNSVRHLKIDYCNNFPNLPKIFTLQQIYLSSVYFSGDFDLDQFFKANLGLKSLYISQMKRHKCEFEEKLINQLEYLRIEECQDAISIGRISSLPSKLKNLIINNCYKRGISLGSLRPIFPKLHNLKKLMLRRIDFNFQQLLTIPSNDLEELIIRTNNNITDQCLQQMDSKWPYLIRIVLYECPLITERILHLCKFKSLMEIGIYWKNLSISAMKYLKRRGIKRII